MRVSFDTWPDCEGDAEVAVEGTLEPSGAPPSTLFERANGQRKSPYELAHAKVIGAAASVCKVTAESPPLGDPFDRAAVAAALKNVKVDDCGPHTAFETFHLEITFARTGKTKTVELDTPLSGGDAVGQCVRARFAKVVVPPFAGYEVKIGKSAMFGP